MKALLIAGAALLAAACGEVETTESPSTETQTIDLRNSGTYTVATGYGDTENEVLVVRANGESVPFGDWKRLVTNLHGVNLARFGTQDGHYVIVTDPTGEMTDDDAQLIARDERIEGSERSAAACPEDCLHCPEDNAFLCAQLCGF